ncbi:MAG: MarC family protein [Alphaproteobacteria bacterium]|nr:MarC family protein [Alphaproteobacteria bacterium]
MHDGLVPALIAFFVVIDPVGLSPVFAGLTAELSPSEKRRTAVKAAAIAGGVLLGFAFLGTTVLEALGIGLPAMRIAGGILLLLAAIDMLFARPSGLRSTTEPENKEARARHDVSVFPLAIPLIAGPGAITTLLLLMGGTGGEPLRQAVVLGALAAVMTATLAAMLFAAGVTRLLGVTGVNVVGRVLGILLASLACQFVIDGLAQLGLSRF